MRSLVEQPSLSPTQADDRALETSPCADGHDQRLRKVKGTGINWAAVPERGNMLPIGFQLKISD